MFWWKPIKSKCMSKVVLYSLANRFGRSSNRAIWYGLLVIITKLTILTKSPNLLPPHEETKKFAIGSLRTAKCLLNINFVFLFISYNLVNYEIMIYGWNVFETG